MYCFKWKCGWIVFFNMQSEIVGSSRHRQITAEILKYGTAKNDVKVFTYGEVCDATNNFSSDCLVGEGGFGNVYKGYIKSIEQVCPSLFLSLIYYPNIFLVYYKLLKSNVKYLVFRL